MKKRKRTRREREPELRKSDQKIVVLNIPNANQRHSLRYINSYPTGMFDKRTGMRKEVTNFPMKARNRKNV